MRARALVIAAALLLSCRESAPLPAPAPPSVAQTTTAEPASRPPARKLPPGDQEPPRLALGENGAVSSQEAHATDVGIDVLKKGGNAIDAAIAVAFALAVTHPSAGNLGGGGFMVVRTADGRAAAIDYRETAPARATRDMYLGKDGEVSRDSLVGAKAAGIPGTVAGMALAHQRFGKLPWKDLVMPAVRLAREGHVVDSFHAADIAEGVGKMHEAGFEDSAAIFSRPDGKPLAEGDLLQQPALAATLEAIAAGGAKVFYEGPIAKAMIEDVAAAGGIWELADLSGYKVAERQPIRFRHRDHEIIAMPPPSGGGVVLAQVLGAADIFGLADKPWRSPAEVHVYIEATRRAYADRNALLADPDHVKVPLAGLLDAAYIEARMADISPERATKSAAVKPGSPSPAGTPRTPGRESEETTHFSVIDAEGNAVSNTYTLNTGFGAKLVLAKTGVLLNNEMDDFAAKPGSANVYGLVQSEQNAIAPGKRMLSSMAPTIVVRGDEVRLIVGSPGGPTISTTVAQILLAVIDHDRNIDEAVTAPRIHHQWLPDLVFVEPGVEASLRDALRALGHELKERPPIGHANCIEVDRETRGFRAVADVPRDGGKAAAY